MTVPYIVEMVPNELNVMVAGAIYIGATPVPPRYIEILNDDV